MGKQEDRDLGLHTKISRRDLMQGLGVAATGASLGVLSSLAAAAEGVATGSQRYYPPLLTGLRGSHVGSFEVAHGLAWGGKRDWGPVSADTGDEYDLVVVGAGLSGLAAAHFYKKDRPGARVLILDNHDDFGGHAKRNEFRVGGRTLLGHGGSQSLDGPSGFSEEVKGLLKDIAVETAPFYSYFDRDFHRRNDLTTAYYFNRATYGTDKVVRAPLGWLNRHIPINDSSRSIIDAIAQFPLSDHAKAQLIALYGMKDADWARVAVTAQPGVLERISYLDFLKQHVGIDSAEALGTFASLTKPITVLGIDGVPAAEAIKYFDLPGPTMAAVPAEPYIFHFPDGNASLARLLVRRLIPGVAVGSTMEDVVTADFDYSKLDLPENPVRLRLSSTVVHAENVGAGGRPSGTSVTYVRDGNAHRVRAKHAILACWNMIIPHICPELPASQKAALSSLVKAPLVYTNVAIRNWNAWKKMGIGAVECPGSRHQLVMLDFPVSMGKYHYSRTPDDPIVVWMNWVPTQPGGSQREQYLAGRRKVYETPFEDIERDIRQHLGAMLAPGGFDPAKEIAAITVNRWPHGYAYAPNPLFDPQCKPEECAHVVGRQAFGRIGIANSDSGAVPYLQCAIEQGARAVRDISS